MHRRAILIRPAIRRQELVVQTSAILIRPALLVTLMQCLAAMLVTCPQVDRMIIMTDLGMGLVHLIVDRDRMATIMDLPVDRMIILNAQQVQLVADQVITMTTRMQLIAEQWEWQMGHLTLIRLRMC